MDPWEEPERFEISTTAFQAINPNRKLWTKAMSQILTGIGMSFLVVPLFHLEIILPLVGGCLMLMGFRTLRRNDVWFERCFIVAAVHLFFVLCSIVLNSTIYRSMIGDSVISFTLALIFPMTTIVLLYCLWKGFLSACKEVGVIFDCSVVLLLLAWYLALGFLIIIQHYGLLMFIIMAVLLIYLLRRSFDLAWAIRAAKYTVTPVEYQISDAMWVSIVGLLLVIAIGISYLFFQKYPMKWEKISVDNSPETEAIRAHLLQLGFPSDFLEDLSKEDIQACKDAVRVVAKSDDIVPNSTPSSGNLKFSFVVVKLSKKKAHWKIFHRFLWVRSPKFIGTESYYRFIEENSQRWLLNENFSGRVLYDKLGESYSSSFYSIQKRTYTMNRIPGHLWIRPCVIATFSFPTEAQCARGYMSYVMEGEIAELDKEVDIKDKDVWQLFRDFLKYIKATPEMNYIHQVSRMQYPNTTAEEKLTQGVWLEGDIFEIYGSSFFQD